MSEMTEHGHACMHIPIPLRILYPFMSLQYVEQTSLWFCSRSLLVIYFILFYLFIYFFNFKIFNSYMRSQTFWPCWVFVALYRLSLAVANGGYSLLQGRGFSLWWLLLLRSTGSSCGSWTLEQGLSKCGTWV